VRVRGVTVPSVTRRPGSYAGRVTISNQQRGCKGRLVEDRPGAGTCDLGDDCEVVHLRDDYLAYRAAHLNITSTWLTRERPDRGRGTQL
jgi:hypothetical protein